MTTNKVEFSPLKAEESYIQSYQTYFKLKNSYQSLLMDISTPSTQTKNTKEIITQEECKVCSIVRKPGDLINILNQGLYYKYTSSQDFFYSKDVTALLENKRQPFCIQYQDDLIYDEEKEHLKTFFKRKQTKTLMDDIKQFYCQFRSYPKVFGKPFFKIMNTHLARHRRLEYVKVFQNNEPSDTSSQDNRLETENQFEFMHMLGETFLKENNKNTRILSMDEVIESSKHERGKETELYLEEVETNFNLLKNLEDRKKKGADSVTALNNNYCVLYSRNDSEAAEEMLKNMLHDFRVLDNKTKVLSKKPEKEKEMPQKNSELEELIKINKEPLENELVRKKVSPSSRPRSSSKGTGLKKLHLDQNSVLKEYMKEGGESRSQLESATNRGISKGGRTSREHSMETRDARLRPESGKSPSQKSNRNRHGLTSQRSLQGTNLLIKFTPDDLKDSVFDRDSLLSKVNQMRSTQNKLVKFNSEEVTSKYQTPTSSYYQPLLVNDGSSTSRSRQIKVSLNSPSTFRNQASGEAFNFKRSDERVSKTPLVRPEIVIPNSKIREARPTIRQRDLVLGFESARSSKSKETRMDIESPGLTRSIKATKNKPKFFTKLLEKEMPLSVRENKVSYEKLNLKNMTRDLYSETCKNIKSPSFEKDMLLASERGVYHSLERRSMSSGILKPRVEVSAERKKEIARSKGNNRSSSRNYQNVSDLYQQMNSSKHKNSGWLKLAEVYLQSANTSRTKCRSNGNTIIQTANTSKVDLSSKLKKKGSMDFEISHSRIKERQKSPFTEDRDLTDLWSPKTARYVSSREKTPKKSPSVKCFKHIRHASRG